MKIRKLYVAAAALSGLLIGTAANAAILAGGAKNSEGTRKTDAGQKALALDGPTTNKSDCKAKNECKGKGGCKSDDQKKLLAGR